MGIIRRVFGFVARPTRSRTMGLTVMLVLVAAVSLTVYIAQQQQQLRQRAAEPSLPPPISIAKCEANCAIDNLNKCEITERVTESNRQQIIDACEPLKSCNDGCPLVEHFSTYIPIAEDLKTLSSYLSSMNAYVTTIKQLTGDQYNMLYSQYYKPKLNQLTEALQSSPTPVPPTDIPVSATVSAIPTSTPTPEPTKFKITNQYVNDDDADVNPKSRTEDCDASTDCVGGYGGCFKQGFISFSNNYSFICSSENKWNSCNASNTCKQQIVDSVTYYCDENKQWKNTIPKECTPTPTAAPSAAPALLAADVNGDGCVSISDFNEWLYAYQNNGTPRNPSYKPNINTDNEVSLLDYNAWYSAMKSGQNLCGQ